MSLEWDGQERRREDRKTIYEELGELRVRVTHIETSLSKIDHISETLDTYVKQGQGIAKMMQILFYVVGPAIAAFVWMRDNIK